MRFSSTLSLFFFTALAACGNSPDAKSPDDKSPHPLMGKPAPEVEGDAVIGSGQVTNKQPGKVVVLDFWATYCKPCLKEFPRLQSLQDRYSGKVSVVGVSEDEEKDDVPPFVTRTGAKFSIVWDQGKKFGGKYSVDAMPSTFVIDGDGVVRFVHRGYHADEAEEIEKEVKQLLAD
jgi:thiol-disulfide isomerase/thioredoxin